MRTTYGNLITLAQNGEFDAIVHGCNCFNTMGGGIAYQISQKFPKAYAADKKTRSGDRKKLGDFTYHQEGDLLIVNAYTQYKCWLDKGEHMPLVNYDAVKSCFAKINAHFGGKGIKWGIPKIGSGLAGGDWDIIAPIIDFAMSGEDVTLVEYVG